MTSSSVRVVPEHMAGVFPDFLIQQYVEEKNMLITENFDKRCLKQACYELRASNTYFDVSDNHKKYVLDEEGSFILLKPKQKIVIMTYESLKLPDNVIGRVMTKGSLFTVGIAAINTCADPGFQGKLGIVFHNNSNNYIKLSIHQPIAKIEFSKIFHPVSNPYSGQHGFETEIWPVKNQLILSKDEIRKDARIKSEIDEIELSHGKGVGSAFRNVLVLKRRMFIAAAMYFIFNFLLLGIALYFMEDADKVLTPLISVLIGLGSNILFAILTFAIKIKK